MFDDNFQNSQTFLLVYNTMIMLFFTCKKNAYLPCFAFQAELFLCLKWQCEVNESEGFIHYSRLRDLN